MVNELRLLMKREQHLVSSVDFCDRFVENFVPDRDARQISLRLSALDEAHREFYILRGKIEFLLEDVEQPAGGTKEEDGKPDQAAINYQAQQKFDDRYFELKAQLLHLKSIHQPEETQTGNLIPATTQQTAYSKVKLPEIRLPSFSGLINEWVVFRDTFKSLIDRNEQLTDIDKFTYLRSSLTGEALQEINAVELSAANYVVAWKALETRYENKKLIVKAYLDALYAVEHLTIESFEGLNRLISDVEKNLQMLDKIGERTAEWSTVLAHMVCSRLDATTLRHWETHHKSKDVPTYANLMSFLRDHCTVLQSVAPMMATNFEARSPKISVCHTTVRVSGRCQFCGASWHSAFQCATFQGMKVDERNEVVFKNRLCRNCLAPGHIARSCEKGVCHHCRQRHHSMLHSGFQQVRSSVSPPQSPPQTGIQQQRQLLQPIPNQQPHTQTDNAQTNAANSHSTNTPNSTPIASTSHTYTALPTTPTHDILLPTALVTVKDRFGSSRLARALLDSCSQHCLMTAAFSRKLNLPESSTYMAVRGIGSACTISNRMVSAEVGSRSKNISTFAKETKFYVLPELTPALPSTDIDSSQWNLPESAVLADPWFCRSGPIDVIVGAEHFVDLLKDGKIRAIENGPTLQRTVFGWTLCGRIPNRSNSTRKLAGDCCSTTSIQKQHSRLFEAKKPAELWPYKPLQLLPTEKRNQMKHKLFVNASDRRERSSIANVLRKAETTKLSSLPENVLEFKTRSTVRSAIQHKRGSDALVQQQSSRSIRDQKLPLVTFRDRCSVHGGR